MKKAIAVVIIISIYFTMTAYIVGMFAGMISNGDVWKSTMEGKAPKLTIETDPIKAIKNTTSSKNAMNIWLIGSIGIAVIGLIFILAYKEEFEMHFGTKVQTDKRNTYGSADWMAKSEAKKVYKLGSKNKGILLGKLEGEHVIFPQETKYNKHIAIFGASGTGKSRTFARPNIIKIAQMEQSMIITDPKGELYEDMATWLINQGYDVKALNLVNIQYSDRWNPLDVIQDDMDATVFADTIIKNTQIGVKKGGDPFWDRAEMNLLKALVLYVKEVRPPEEQNLGEVYKLLANTTMQNLQALFSNIPNDRASKMAYNIFAQANQTVQTGVIIGLGTRLQVFQNTLVQAMTAVSDIDLEKPKKDKVAYFCIMSDTHSAFDFISSLFFSFLFIKLVNLHDTTQDAEIRAREVYFILDEFPNIGEIPDFTKKIATIRSRNLHCSIIFQSITQLEEKYHEQWETIIGNCDTKLFLGANDTRTSEYISNVLGIKSIHTRSTSRQGGLEGLTEVERITQSVGKRPLLTPDEVYKLDNSKAIVMLRGKKPLMVDKVDISTMKESKQLISKGISTYVKEWNSPQPVETQQLIQTNVQTPTQTTQQQTPTATGQMQAQQVNDNIKEQDNDEPNPLTPNDISQNNNNNQNNTLPVDDDNDLF
ncbi:VirD4-like conjugal transfer protein, CD1115 family [Caldicellulosiruptoraceae bacterium PP1]